MYIVVAKVFDEDKFVSCFSDYCYGHFFSMEKAEETIEQILDDHDNILAEDLQIWEASALFTNLTVRREVIIA